MRNFRWDVGAADLKVPMRKTRLTDDRIANFDKEPRRGKKSFGSVKKLGKKLKNCEWLHSCFGTVWILISSWRDGFVGRWRCGRHLVGVRHHLEPGRPRGGLERGLRRHPGHEEENLHVSPPSQGNVEADSWSGGRVFDPSFHFVFSNLLGASKPPEK